MPKEKPISKTEPNSSEATPSGRAAITDVGTDVVSDTIPVEQKADFKEKKVQNAPKKSVLKQEVFSQALTSKSGAPLSVQSPGIMMMRVGSYSGNEASILSGLADVPSREDSARSNSRYGKKRDRASSHIDEIVSEQVIQSFETAPGLASSKEDDEGYTGRVLNSNIRIQKIGGAVPMSGDFVRSLDIVKRDEVFFADGQYVGIDGVDYGETPTKTFNPSTLAWDDLTPTSGRGSFIPRKLTVAFNSSGRLTKFAFTVDDVTARVPSNDGSGNEVLNIASHARAIAINKIEIARLHIQDIAGNEVNDNFTPLARSIQQPSRYLSLMRDIELDSGSHIYMAKRMLDKSLAYQMNKATKDGTAVERAVNEMVRGTLEAATSSAGLTIKPNSGIFAKAEYLVGSPAAMIKLIDSTDKYNKRSDFLTLPRGFRLYSSSYENYAKVYKINPTFVEMVEKYDVFSTIDRDYDALLPVYLTDGISVVSPRNWNDLYSFSGLTQGGERDLTSDNFTIGYDEERNRYYTQIDHYLLKGIADYLERFGAKWYSMIGSDDMVIPIIYNTTSIAMWPLLVLGALQDITMARNNSMREIIDYEMKNHEYIFNDLVGLSSIDVHKSNNYRFVDTDSPLIVERMSRVPSITWQMPELFSGVSEDLSTRFYITPWYFAEEALDALQTGAASFSVDYGKQFYHYPECRSGFRFGPLDAVYSYKPKEIRLAMDFMVYPVTRSYDAKKIYVHKYSLGMSGTPTVNLADSVLTPLAILSTPRQLGWHMVSPYGYTTPSCGVASANLLEDTQLVDGSASAMFGAMSYVARIYGGAKLTSLDMGDEAPINNPVDLSVTRASQFQQVWFDIPSVRQSSEDRFDLGYLLSVADMFDEDLQLIKGRATYIPFVGPYVTASGSQTAVTDEGFRLVSLQKGFYGRINLLQMAISPFDATSGVGVIADDDGIKYDPYDLLAIFNFAGFRPIDFGEALYNRVQRRDQLGFTYINDLWLEEFKNI